MNARTAVNVHVKTVRAGTGFPNRPARHPPDVADQGRLQPRLPPADTETADPLATPDPTAQTRPGARHHPGWAPPPGGNPHVARPTTEAVRPLSREGDPGRGGLQGTRPRPFQTPSYLTSRHLSPCDPSS